MLESLVFVRGSCGRVTLGIGLTESRMEVEEKDIVLRCLYWRGQVQVDKSTDDLSSSDETGGRERAV